MKKTILNNKVEIIGLFETIQEKVTGYWAGEVWNIYEYPLHQEGDWGRSIQNLSFETFQQPQLRALFQYYFYDKLTRKHMKPGTAWTYYSQCLKKLGNFFSVLHPQLQNMLDIPWEKFLLQYQTFLMENYKRVYKKDTEFFKRIYKFYVELSDTRDETEKDCWDVRKLGITYNRTKSSFKLHFEKIPTPLRELAKRYIKQRLITIQNMEFGTAIEYTYMFNDMFQAIFKKNPTWTDLTQLKREDISFCIEQLRNKEHVGSPRKRKTKATNYYINKKLVYFETFLSDIQRYEWSEAPQKSVHTLIFPEDKPKRERTDPDKIKHIPDYIWDQLLQHVHLLPPDYVPLVMVMEATGFRGSDVLSLKLDCLQKRDDGWWISGDQMKVDVKDHRVPIHEDIAQVLTAQIEYITSKSTPQNNPDRFLFCRLDGKRIGEPISTGALSFALNEFAKKAPILDEKGEVYHFKNHAFRHRYGVNLVNKGMNLVLIQKLMAHASPEMTLIYARILDTTLREEWEKAQSQGAVRLTVRGDLVEANLASQAEENGLELEWIRHNYDLIRLDHGFCVKSPRDSCDFLNYTYEPPCIKNNCQSFHVDSTFLSYYESEVQKIEKDIKMYQELGRQRSIEIVQPKIKRYQEIIESLQKNGGHFGLPKAKREYPPEERMHHGEPRA